MEQFERLLRSCLERLATMVSMAVDLQSTESCLSGSILILGMTQDIYFLPELKFDVKLLCF